MKYLVPFSWIIGGIFAVPFAVMSYMGFFSLEYFAINVALLALPQFVWSFARGPWLPLSAYIGGFVGGNSLLIFSVLFYFFVITKDDPYNEGFAFGTVFFYLPYSVAAIPVAALVGYLIGRGIRAIPTW